MALVRVLQVEAGQYCTFVVYGDGTVKACGKVRHLASINTCVQMYMYIHVCICTYTCSSHVHTQGSYGRLGLGNSDNQPTLKEVTDFPRGTVVRKLASSRGSDGHTIAVDTTGHCYSWGDGEEYIHVYGRQRSTSLWLENLVSILFPLNSSMM